MLFEINVWNYNIILQDFLVQLESKKARVLSINLTSKNFINLRTQEGRELHDRLRLINRRWEAVCDRANNMQKDLKVSLMQCSEFHHTIHDLLLWLENVETKVQQCEPINRGSDEGALWTKLRKLKVLFYGFYSWIICLDLRSTVSFVINVLWKESLNSNGQ